VGAKLGFLKYFFKVATPELIHNKEESFWGMSETDFNK
jgi:hypothetical protein